MIVGIHQPHFIPWVGYFDKMAKSDIFVLLDQVQLEKGSYMYRNRIVDVSGNVSYLTISADKHGYLDKSFKDIRVKDADVWMPKHLDMLKCAYGFCEYFGEIYPLVEELYQTPPETVCEFDIRSIELIASILGIRTKLVMQSTIPNVEEGKKNELVLNICKALGADGYLSGNGARKYTDENTFAQAGIMLRYQSITVPTYEQRGTQEFVGGLSILDMLFNVGAKETCRLFWDMVFQGNEFAREERCTT